jgi:hypothetical protein
VVVFGGKMPSRLPVVALTKANRELLAAMKAHQAARHLLAKAELRLRLARRQVALLVSAVAQP